MIRRTVCWTFNVSRVYFHVVSVDVLKMNFFVEDNLEQFVIGNVLSRGGFGKGDAMRKGYDAKKKFSSEDVCKRTICKEDVL